MAAYEDFSFFSKPPARGTAARRPAPESGERRLLRAEVERLDAELRRLRSMPRPAHWSERLRRFVLGFVPGSPSERGIGDSGT